MHRQGTSAGGGRTSRFSRTDVHALAPPVLRGREAELSELAEAIGGLADGRGHVLVIEGPPGIGKSVLLREACDRSTAAGVRMLLGEASEALQAVPLAPLLAALSTAVPPVLDADTVRNLETARDTRYWMLHDLQAALEVAASRSPLVIALDDLHWADNATLTALRSLGPVLAGLPVLWLLAVRTGRRRRPVNELLSRLERDGAARMLLGPLAPPVIGQVVADVVRARPGDRLMALADGAQGNPFLVVELLRGLSEEGRLRVAGRRAEVVDDGPSRRLSVLVTHRLAALSAEAQQVVRVAAALPARFTAVQLASALRWAPSTLVAPLQEALEADLLAEAGAQLRFRHDLLRQAVLGTLPRSMRRALQRDAVALLLDTGAAPGEMALQLAESADPGDRWAALTLRDAARRIAGSDTTTAADLGRRALELLPPDDPDRGLLTAETISLLHRARRSDEAAALADHALAALLPPAEEAEVRLSLAGMMTRPTGARAEENRRALALPRLPSVLRGRHRAWLAYNLAMGSEGDGARVAATAALQDAQATGDLETRVLAELAVASGDVAAGDVTSALERIDRLRPLCRSHEAALFTAVTAFHRAFVLAVLGRLDEARTIVVDGVVTARRERDALLLSTWTQFGGMLRLAAGELEDARVEAAWSVPPDGEPAADTFAGLVRMAALCHVGAHAGDTVSLQAGRSAARAVRADGSPAVRRLATRLLVTTATGPDAAADAARLLADDPLLPATPLVPCDYGYQPRIARMALEAGARDLAERAAAVTETVDRRNPGVPLFAGLAAQTRGIVTSDTGLLVEASRLLLGTQRPLVAASAAEDAGVALARTADTARAVDQLNTAFDLYTALGANADARRVARLLRRQGVLRRLDAERPRTGWSSLTGSELQVVRIIGRGATNRMAAEQLYLSPHTVSSHLRSAFTKLGINSRVQLARVLQEVEP